MYDKHPFASRVGILERFRQARFDSLTMLGAAAGSAILAMLFTLLVLTVLNGGTLRFAKPQEVREVWIYVDGVDANLDQTIDNLDTLNERVSALEAAAQ